MRPRFLLKEGMRCDLLSPFVVVHEIVDDDLGDSSVLHHCDMVKALLIDVFGLDEAQEVPLGQHPHLGDKGRLAQKRAIPFLPLKLGEVDSGLRNGMVGRVNILQPFLAQPFW